MIHRRNRAIALGLSLFAFALSGALFAGAAQAEWLEHGETLEEVGIAEEQIAGASSGAFKFKISTLNISIKCNTTTSSGTIVKGGTDKETLKFTECHAFDSKEIELGSCTVEPITFEAATELIEVSGVVYDKYTPSSGKAFGTAKFKGAECSLPPSIEVTGSTAAELKEEELVEQPFVFSEKISSTTKTALLFGKNSGTIEGTLKEKLSGKQKGNEWQGAVVTTALCRTNALMTCAGSEIFAKFSAVESALEGTSVAELKLIGASFETKCSKSILNSETLTKRAQPVLLKVLNFTLEACTNSCTVSESTIGPAPSAVRAIQGEFPNGNLTFARTKIKIECGGVPSRKCLYEQTNLVEKLVGGNPNAKIKVSGAQVSLINQIEGTCGTEVQWTANYLISAVAPLFVTK